MILQGSCGRGVKGRGLSSEDVVDEGERVSKESEEGPVAGLTGAAGSGCAMGWICRPHQGEWRGDQRVFFCTIVICDHCQDSADLSIASS